MGGRRIAKRYTDEQLIHAVQNSVNMAEVLRNLGLCISGGSHKHFTKRVQTLKLDTSHFEGTRVSLRGVKKIIPWREVLVLRDGDSRAHHVQLKRALISSGVPYNCSSCNCGDTWNDKPITLQIDHINHNWLDDRKENLAFLCPNCHSQTEGWCGRKTKSTPKEKVATKSLNTRDLSLCPTCNVNYKSKQSNQCVVCASADHEKIKWPISTQLAVMTWKEPMSVIAKRLGVSDVALKKRCKKLGLQTPPRGYWAKQEALKKKL